MSKDNGGPAFPWCGNLNECPTINLGMSLRDYFAAKAASALISKSSLRTDEMITAVAVASYGIADAMLAERAK